MLGGEAWLVDAEGSITGILPAKEGGTAHWHWETEPERGEDEPWRVYCSRAATQANEALSNPFLEEHVEVPTGWRVMYNLTYCDESEHGGLQPTRRSSNGANLSPVSPRSGSILVPPPPRPDSSGGPEGHSGQVDGVRTYLRARLALTAAGLLVVAVGTLFLPEGTDFLGVLFVVGIASIPYVFYVAFVRGRWGSLWGAILLIAMSVFIQLYVNQRMDAGSSTAAVGYLYYLVVGVPLVGVVTALDWSFRPRAGREPH